MVFLSFRKKYQQQETVFVDKKDNSYELLKKPTDRDAQSGSVEDMTEIEHSQAKRDFGIYTQARCFILVLRPFPKTREMFYVINKRRI